MVHQEGSGSLPVVCDAVFQTALSLGRLGGGFRIKQVKGFCFSPLQPSGNFSLR